MLRTPDVKFVGMSHFNNVTSSSSIKEKRAEKVVKKKYINHHHIKGISIKLLILKGQLSTPPGNIGKDLLCLHKIAFFKRLA